MDSQLLVEALDINKVDSSAYAAVIEDTKMYGPNNYEEWEAGVPALVAACALGDSAQHR